MNLLKNDTEKFRRRLILTKTGKVRKAAKPSSEAEFDYYKSLKWEISEFETFS